MNRLARIRSRYVISGLAAAMMAVGGLLVSSPAASASPNFPVGSPNPTVNTLPFELEISGVFQEYDYSVDSLTHNSVDVTRGPVRSQLINNLAGCRTRAHVLNLVTINDFGAPVRSFNLYNACVVRVTTAAGQEKDTIGFSYMTTTPQPATS
ncbi:hypothetical protein [Streptomyces broussonetiae]|uniref:Uncharacterized protein n=1 Tax=Streptomyces broussonetiae TaxID=2686304 RepID=A0A6I6NM81_9ACTN|nr:hypothetical protein [Streptomyces broussonetiae]QHA09256.1 hypothetical protein GQF42_44200 [Streptomyces broussonetiae]